MDTAKTAPAAVAGKADPAGETATAVPAMTLDALTRAKMLQIPERIETERLILVASDATQVEATFAAAYASRHELSLWMPWAHPEPTLQGVTKHHADARAHWFARDMFHFQIYEKSCQKLVGKCSFHHVDWDIPKLEIGYWLLTSAAGNGYCTEAVNALVELARNVLGAARLEICADPDNAKSRAVAERCGFILEGILKQNFRAPNGSLRDSCMYALVLN